VSSPSSVRFVTYGCKANQYDTQVLREALLRRVLARMKRWYTVVEYLEACDRIRARLDRPAYTADLLVGFPGETRSDFENTLATTERAGSTRVHAFPFSPRPGTAAWDLPDRVDPTEVRERRAAPSELAGEVAHRYLVTLDGAAERVVLEGFAGLSGRYQRVRVAPQDLEGLPAAVDVTLEVREVAGDEGRKLELWGHRRVGCVG
jgi:threonylcarbamoyladenosine tRNA methylthiotransferase MtaB